jgi:hypothetical protein
MEDFPMWLKLSIWLIISLYRNLYAWVFRLLQPSYLNSLHWRVR